MPWSRRVPKPPEEEPVAAAAAVAVRECRWCSSPRQMFDGALWCTHCDIVHDERDCEKCRRTKNRHDVRNDYHGPPIPRSDWARERESL